MKLMVEKFHPKVDPYSVIVKKATKWERQAKRYFLLITEKSTKIQNDMLEAKISLGFC
jgi:hypothetical protein